MPEWEERWPWESLQTDQEIREQFLRESQPFIRRVASQVCHRNLDWGRDEELSEALIAFNDAIAHYVPGRGVPFLAYARVLIKRRLVDYFRRQPTGEVAWEITPATQALDSYLSLGEFIEQEQNRERATEIKEYVQELSRFQLTLNDLVEASPKHRDTRATLLQAARELGRDEALWAQVEQKGKIPMQALALKTKIHPKVLERGRKYILAVGLLVAHQNDYIYLREYVIPAERGIR